MAAPRRKFTIEDKRRLLEMYEQLPQMTQKKAASHLNITQSVLWSILRNRSRIMRGDPDPRCGSVPRLEAALWRWIDGSRQQGSPVSDLMIHRKAMALASRMGVTHFRASPTWYSGFKRRERTVRERYNIYPDDTDHVETPVPKKDSRPAAQTLQHPQTKKHREAKRTADQPEVHLEHIHHHPVKLEPSEPVVVTAEMNGNMQTITVPSLYQMKEAMKTLATGLLYRGFSDFKLLHQFEKEVSNVVKRSMAQGSQDSFIA